MESTRKLRAFVHRTGLDQATGTCFADSWQWWGSGKLTSLARVEACCTYHWSLLERQQLSSLVAELATASDCTIPCHMPAPACCAQGSRARHSYGCRVDSTPDPCLCWFESSFDLGNSESCSCFWFQTIYSKVRACFCFLGPCVLNDFLH